MSEILKRIITEHNYNSYRGLTSETFECLSNLTTRSTLLSNYETFLYNVQIPFECFCIEILKKIEERYIHIPLVKKIVKKSFILCFDKDGFKNSNDEAILDGRFIILINAFNIEYRLGFCLELQSDYISYFFNINSFDKTHNLYLFHENCKKMDDNLINRFEQQLLYKEELEITDYLGVDSSREENTIFIQEFSQLLNISDNYLIYAGKKINYEHDYISYVYEGFTNFLVLSLLATSENPMQEIDLIWNYENYDEEEIKKIIRDMKPQETYIEETELNQYIKTLKRKKHIIFQGSPGTGKTYLAKHIANHLTSSGDGFYELIQFHPSYSYEDFIQGIRPQTSPDGHLNYSMIPGRFLTFCEKTENCEDMCILIIDEINRANLSQVFGELMYLLEYREEEIQLAGSDQKFKIPENVYIIGTMNTADRSIALVDHALRRRFAFIPIKPNYNILEKYHEKNDQNYDIKFIESLINILRELNETINDRNYEIGVSFFLTKTLKEDLEDIWTMEIEPYLEEYFFDQTDKIDKFRWTKIKDKLK